MPFVQVKLSAAQTVECPTDTMVDIEGETCARSRGTRSRR
jgi:hypothetical protein